MLLFLFSCRVSLKNIQLPDIKESENKNIFNELNLQEHKMRKILNRKSKTFLLISIFSLYLYEQNDNQEKKKSSS